MTMSAIGPFLLSGNKINDGWVANVATPPPFGVSTARSYFVRILCCWLERLASNATIAAPLREAGFAEVSVSGGGATRHATALWPLDDKTAEVPPQVVEIVELDA
jgi:hypothetical protein